jgi:hypothetical protein
LDELKKGQHQLKGGRRRCLFRIVRTQGRESGTELYRVKRLVCGTSHAIQNNRQDMIDYSPPGHKDAVAAAAGGVYWNPKRNKRGTFIDKTEKKR